MRFDIRAKLVVFLCVSVGTFMAASLMYEALAVGLIAGLQLFSGRTPSGKRVVSVGLVSVYLFLLAIQLYIMPELPPVVSMSMSIPVVQIRKMFPMAMVLLWIVRTTSVSEIIATMTRIGCPKALTVTFAVTLRYFPSIVEEWTAVREAMKLRRIQIMRGNPVTRALRKAECHIMPMIAAASRTSDELASAASCRGIDNPAKATCLAYRPLALSDGVLMGTGLVMTVAAAGVRMWS